MYTVGSSSHSYDDPQRDGDGSKRGKQANRNKIKETVLSSYVRMNSNTSLVRRVVRRKHKGCVLTVTVSAAMLLGREEWKAVSLTVVDSH